MKSFYRTADIYFLGPNTRLGIPVRLHGHIIRINSRAATVDHSLDNYWTPPQATRALVAVERLPKSIADPCVGTGNILNTLEAAGHIVPYKEFDGVGSAAFATATQATLSGIGFPPRRSGY